MSEFIIACGGTGGHLAPGIALAEQLQARGHSSRLLISEKGIDATITAKYPQFRFEKIPGAPLIMDPSGFGRFLVQQLRGLWFSLRLIRRTRPDMIVGFGGFTTAAIILGGRLMRVPVALYEANRVPGRAVRALARFAKRVYVPRAVEMEEASQWKLRHVGLPVRSAIKRMPRNLAANVFGLDAERPVVAVLGGSQGAQALNRWAEDAASQLARHGLQMLVVTGPDKGDAAVDTNPGPRGEQIRNSKLPFCDNMAALYSASDLVVSRSGAGTLAELVACQVPAILVPYPYAADDHQAANAQEFERLGGGGQVREENLSSLLPMVEGLMADDSRLALMRVNLRQMGLANNLDLMMTDMENLASRHHGKGRSRSEAAHA
ncbi:MAG: UDP-N-acetylglucosamine--N-acetylmuramyl-(pentapeptide) pyrophosphoryl-undecaprenol N-acetylglucosamine transferase [Candidatus Synoicihabitans palmerolidicus]|nr:UDP-N-acetylglucosamine--N-acetylmuramyl-(pentapeptide) pyrophosphoryl-undecaprenol N-acetylglucosamine transferase [Candidatus Synoicihabitans palmerolidicus]